MPLSISDSLSHVAGRVIVEVVDYLILPVDGVEEAAEKLDLFSLVLEEFDNLAVIVKVGHQNEVGEVGGHLEVDVHLEADEIHEFVDLGDPVTPVKHGDGEGGGREGGDGGLSLDDDIEGGGHGELMVVAAGKASNWCRTGF